MQKTSFILRILGSVCLLGFVGSLNAATHYVSPGESIQNAINSATAGDTIVIFGGTYSESITLNKILTIQKVSGPLVFITGDVTITGVTAPTNSPMIISNLKVGGDGSKRLRVNGCANLLINNVDLSDSGFAANSSDNISVANGAIGRSEITTSSVNFSRVNIANHLTVDNRATPERTLSFLQSSITNNHIFVRGGNARILYSRLQQFVHESADTVLVGCKILRNIGYDPAIDLAAGKAVIRNNDLSHQMPPPCCDYVYSAFNGLRLNNTEALISNNYIHDLTSSGLARDASRIGIWVLSASRKVEIVGNILARIRLAVEAPHDNVTFRFNNIIDSVGTGGGGVIGYSNIAVFPFFVDQTGGDYRLSTNSACINAGPPEAWFNDRDGSRNDIGIFGGLAYDPDGWTTDKPITFLLQASPLTVIKGVHTNLTISGGGIVIAK